MSRLTTINPNHANPEAKALLETVKAKLGVIPNMTRVMANSPAVLEGWLNLFGTLGTTLTPRLRALLAITIAEANSCQYCLAIHTAVGQGAKIPGIDLEGARLAHNNDPKLEAALRFAHSVSQRRGHVSDEEFASVRNAGYSDAEIAEIIAHVAINTLTNYFNSAAATDLDFPRLEPLVAAQS
jgi:uncharacterized peroxidase-related enzyme